MDSRTLTGISRDYSVAGDDALNLESLDLSPPKDCHSSSTYKALKFLS